jgi:DNA polymerase III subunit epsilon
MRQIFLDTETTGLYADQGDRIIEIGCVEMVNRRLTGNNLHFYLNPGRDSHEEALKVHGISNEFLRDKPPFPAIVDELLQYVAGAEIIIHNAAFDLGFLNQELSQLKRPVFREFVGSVTDTLVMAKEMFPGKRNSLDALCDRLGVDNSGRTLHGALLDAELLADVYVNMTRGQEALLIESSTPQADPTGTSSVDLRRLVLPVLTANAQELEAHADVLRQLDKASGGKTVWQAVGV